jgi:transposase-like protein
VSRTSYTPEQKAEALRLYAEHGVAEAARRTGIKAGTISSWARRTGTQSEAPTARAEQVQRTALTLQQKKQRFADGLAEDLERLRAQLFAPTVEQKIVTIAGGLQHEGRWAVATVERERPTFAEQARIMTAIGIGVDKLQVLTGGATQRIGVEGDREVEEVAAEVLHLVQGGRSA